MPGHPQKRLNIPNTPLRRVRGRRPEPHARRLVDRPQPPRAQRARRRHVRVGQRHRQRPAAHAPQRAEQRQPRLGVLGHDARPQAPRRAQRAAGQAPVALDGDARAVVERAERVEHRAAVLARRRGVERAHRSPSSGASARTPARRLGAPAAARCRATRARRRRRRSPRARRPVVRPRSRRAAPSARRARAASRPRPRSARSRCRGGARADHAERADPARRAEAGDRRAADDLAALERRRARRRPPSGTGTRAAARRWPRAPPSAAWPPQGRGRPRARSGSRRTWWRHPKSPASIRACPPPLASRRCSRECPLSPWRPAAGGSPHVTQTVTVPAVAPGRAARARRRPSATRVIRGWSDTLRRGDVDGAARYFALPSIVQIEPGGPGRAPHAPRATRRLPDDPAVRRGVRQRPARRPLCQRAVPPDRPPGRHLRRARARPRARRSSSAAARSRNGGVPRTSRGTPARDRELRAPPV